MAIGRWLTALRMRLRSLVRRSAAEIELQEELQFHIDQATADFEARGMPRPLARRAALLSIGGLDRRKEECREARGIRAPQAVGRDVRLAGRLLRRQPAFAAAVILTLAVGIGAVVSVVTVANWLLLRPLPGVTDPASLVAIRLAAPDFSSAQQMSFNDVEQLAGGVPALTGLTGIQDIPTSVSVALSGRAAQRLTVEFVMANYFDVLGVTVRGRGFTVDEERVPGAPSVAIVSERLAGMHGDGDPIGRTVVINGRSSLIVGVTTGGFGGTKRWAPNDIWMPLAQLWTAFPTGANAPDRIGPGGQRMWGLIGRRDPTLPLAVLAGQLARAERGIRATLPPESRRFERAHFQAVETLERNPVQVGEVVVIFRILVGAAVLLLLLACANAGNALLARAATRSGELATRLALGASRWRLARALFVEGLVLSLVAGAVGLGIAALVARLMDGTAIFASMPAMERPTLDRFVGAVSVAVSLAVGVGASLSAMWSVRHTSVASALRQSTRSVASGRRRVTHALTVIQVAVSLVLLIGAALFVRSVDTMLGIDVGFDRARVHTFRLDPRRPRGAESLAFRLDLIERLRSIPGVRVASAAFLPPFYSGVEAQLLIRSDDGSDRDADTRVMLNAVHPRFFETVGLQLVAGRDFTDAELQLPQAQTPLILAESVAQRVFGTTDVVGRFVVTQSKERRQVVGVVRDSRQRRLTADDTMELAFQPHRADYLTPFVTGVIRVDSPDLSLWPDVRRTLAELDPTVVMFEAKSAEEGVRAEISSRILTMRVALAIGGVAVFLAAVGLATVLARGLAERRHELGIRTALGATPARLAALIGRQSIVLLATGVTTGTLATVWLTRYVESRLYGISPLDSASFLWAIGIVVIVMVAVSLPICSRAAMTNPASMLKDCS